MSTFHRGNPEQKNGWEDPERETVSLRHHQLSEECKDKQLLVKFPSTGERNMPVEEAGDIFLKIPLGFSQLVGRQFPVKSLLSPTQTSGTDNLDFNAVYMYNVYLYHIVELSLHILSG